MALDWGWIWNNFKWAYFLGIIALILLGFFCGLNYFMIPVKMLDDHYWYVMCGITFSLIYLFATRFYNNLYPYRSTGSQINDYSQELMKDFFKSNITVKSPSKKKNLIIFEAESMELQMFGKYNKVHKLSMPIMTKYAERGSFYTNVLSQAYTTWSVASTFAVHCNMPFILPYAVGHNVLKFHLSDKHKCIGDFLHKAGYKLYSYLCNYFVGMFKEMMVEHHWQTYDKREHNFTYDMDMFNHLTNKVLPELATNKSKQPFVLHIANTDTHPIPYPLIDERCNVTVPDDYPRIMKSFSCYEQLVDKFLKKFEELGMEKDTEVVIYGDHYLMKGTTYGLTLTEPRYLNIFWPYREKYISKKRASIFDLGPTILDVLNIQYAPTFPFGNSLFKKDSGIVPNMKSYQMIFNIFSNEMKWKEPPKCGNYTGFCDNT